MCILDLSEWELRIDYWLNSSTGQQWSNFPFECRGSSDLLVQRSRTHHRSDYMETFAEYLIEVDLSLATGDATDENEPSPRCHRFEAGGEVRTSIQVEDDVKAAVAGHALGKSRKPC